MKKIFLIMINKKAFILFLISMFLTTCLSCTAPNQPLTYTGYYFDTIVNLTFYNNKDAKLAEECFDLCQSYENLLSRTVEGSDIWNINHSNGVAVTVSPETYALLEEALFYCELSRGKIDITVAPLMDLWNFTDATKEQTPPTQGEIDALLTHVDYRLIELENNTVTLKDPKAAIDLGFIAKGYIADRIKEYLISQGVESALINLGGNICAIGNKPDGTAYTIGIQEPFAPGGTTLDTIEITNTSIVTSGTYERYFTYNNTIYHHILDATTGYPSDSSLTSVTIICTSALQADALSTTCFVLGKDKALEYINSLDGAECILVDTQGNLYYSHNINPDN